MLFFLNDQVDVMSHDDLISLCTSFYTEDEVKEAKTTLYRQLQCESNLTVRRSDARKKNISDMLHLLSSTEILPVKFCVTNTRRLPPVTIDHVDVAVLMRKLMETRTELLKCQAAQSRYAETPQISLSGQQVQIDELRTKVYLKQR